MHFARRINCSYALRRLLRRGYMQQFAEISCSYGLQDVSFHLRAMFPRQFVFSALCFLGRARHLYRSAGASEVLKRAWVRALA